MAETSPREALLRRITRARDAAGITDVELAERTLIARTTLQRKLAGVVEFTIGELDAIATVLDLDLNELVNAYTSAKVAA